MENLCPYAFTRETILSINTCTIIQFGLVYGAKRHFQLYFSYIGVVNFIGGGIRKKNPLTCRKSLTNFIT